LFLKLDLYFFFFFLWPNDLILNDVTLILGADMDANVSIEIHMNYDKLLILREKKKSDKGPYLKFVQNRRIIFLKLKTQLLNSNKLKI
jgi:hypothetical protein